jgi:hypothetical protein
VWKEQIVRQNTIYSVLATPTLTSQAFERVEWDLPALPYAEMGYTFTTLSLGGLVLLIARPSSRHFGIGCALFAAALIGLHSRYTFQGFRNLLPLAALACVTTGVAIAAAGERWNRPHAAALAGTVLLIVLFGPAAHDYALERARLVDSRRQAVDWIAANAGTDASVLILDETAIAKADLARAPGAVRVAPWEEARPSLRKGEPRFLLAPSIVRPNGEPLIPHADRVWLLERYRVRATFGSDSASISRFNWRGNNLRLWVLEKNPAIANGESSSS